MALRLLEGGNYTSTSPLTSKWSTLTTITMSASVRTGSGAGCINVANGGVLGKLLDAQATWIVGAAVWLETLAAANILIELFDSATTQVELRVTAAGELQVTRNATQLGITSGLGIVAGVWYHIQFKATINNSTGSYEVRLNGVNILSGSSVDTQNTANATADTIRFRCSVGASGDNRFDDIWICDSTGSAPHNDFLGDIKVVSILADGAGNSAQWTPSAGSNFQNIDEGTYDSDTTYNSSSTAAQKDSFTYSAIGESGTVYGVNINIWHRKDDAGARTIRQMQRISATNYFESNITVADSYGYAGTLRTTSPATAVAYTVSEIDGAEFGYELVS